MKVSWLLFPIQDGQLQPAVCLNWHEHYILKWYFSKISKYMEAELSQIWSHMLYFKHMSKRIYNYVLCRNWPIMLKFLTNYAQYYAYVKDLCSIFTYIKILMW